MEFVISDKVVADCNRAKRETSFITERQKQTVDYELSKKLQNLEYYRKELLTHKSNLNLEMNSFVPYEDRLKQTRNSLEYPKQISLKCLETREDRLGDDLRKDDVEIQLDREIKYIEQTQDLFDDLLGKVKEQLREYRSIVYSLERDFQNKESALAVEKQNASIKITDLSLPEDFNSIPKHTKDLLNDLAHLSWQDKSELLMNRSKSSIKNGRQLRFRIEELLASKTKDLIDQHNKCNEVFQKRISFYKDAKNKLEKQLSKINEQIFQMKQNMKELENAMAEKEPYLNVAQIRLNNRIQALHPELRKDEVETKLLKELHHLKATSNTLMSKYTLAQETLLSLNKAKDHLEREINVKTTSVKIDEVQCLTLRSSVHYHAY
ncbi:tektin-1 [Planococcus citri]|uniref:tektin-1 n=1 Tax=Planococcus citri TaxID=170843 RepID=UPI0031F7FE0C